MDVGLTPSVSLVGVRLICRTLPGIITHFAFGVFFVWAFRFTLGEALRLRLGRMCQLDGGRLVGMSSRGSEGFRWIFVRLWSPAMRCFSDDRAHGRAPRPQRCRRLRGGRRVRWGSGLAMASTSDPPKAEHMRTAVAVNLGPCSPGDCCRCPRSLGWGERRVEFSGVAVSTWSHCCRPRCAFPRVRQYSGRPGPDIECFGG